MKRVTKAESRKGASSKNCTVSNPFKALNNRSFNLRSALLSGQETLQFPFFFDEVRGEDDGSSTTVFGRSYHTIAPEVAANNRVASELVHQIPTGSELAGIFDSEGDSMGARPYPNPTPSTSTSTIPPSFHVVASSNGTANDRQSDSLFILGGGHMAPTVASPRKVMNDDSEKKENKINVISYHAPDGHNQFQEQQQDHLIFIPW